MYKCVILIYTLDYGTNDKQKGLIYAEQRENPLDDKSFYL